MNSRRATLLRAALVATVSVPFVHCGEDSGRIDNGTAQPVQVNGQETGYAKWSNGALTRPAIRECPSVPPQAGECKVENAVGGNCTTDKDCTDKPFGFCGAMTQYPSPGCYCNYGCKTDDDCRDDQICQCGEPLGRCVSATCKSDSDCQQGGCALADSPCGSHVFACQQNGDECASSEACAAKDPNKPYCLVSDNGRRKCDGPPCVAGRPLVMEQELRLAGLQAGSGWD